MPPTKPKIVIEAGQQPMGKSRLASGQVRSKARLAQLEAMKAAAKPELMPGARATLASGPNLPEFIKGNNPRLSVKKGEMHVSLSGEKSMPLAEAIGLVNQVIAKTQASGNSAAVARLQQAKQKLEGLTKVEAMLKQLPPTEGVMASPAQAAALQRDKMVYEVNPNAPSGHFVKRSSADYQAEATPADARAARMAAYMATKEAPAARVPAEILTAIREKLGGSKLVTGSQIRASGAVTTRGAKPPSEKERIALNRAQYLEDVGGSGYSGGVPSRIENIGSPTVSDILRRGRRLIDTLGKMPTKKAASTFKALKVEMDQAVKDGAVSREVADSALNRIVEGIMTSGYGDALLSRISGGKSIRPEGIKTKRGMSPEAKAIEDKRRKAELESPSSRGGSSVRLEGRQDYDKRAVGLQVLSELVGNLEKSATRKLNFAPKRYTPSGTSRPNDFARFGEAQPPVGTGITQEELDRIKQIRAGGPDTANRKIMSDFVQKLQRNGFPADKIASIIKYIEG